MTTELWAQLGALICACGVLNACGDTTSGDTTSGDTSNGDTTNGDTSAVLEDGLEPDEIETTAVDTNTVDDSSADVSGDVSGDVIVGSTEPLEEGTEPCERPDLWPFSVESSGFGLRVHYRIRAEEQMAKVVLGELEFAWRAEVDGMGWDAPPDDKGTCGPDGSLDVFIWRDAAFAFVNVWEENPATRWDDGFPYMVLDPFGEFGGDELPATVAHEFNHACQAALDWYDTTFIYEATATFVEDEVLDDHNSYQYLLFDFQGHPEWSIDHDDDYTSWYMYGAMLYLRYLRDQFFDGDGSFVVDVWRGMRSAGDENEPDFVDSVERELAEFGKSYEDTVLEFARWRWYVRDRDDGLHLEEAGGWPRSAVVDVAGTLSAEGGTIVVKPMIMGSVYIDVSGSAVGARDITVALETTEDEGAVHFVVQLLPGLADGSDGDFLAEDGEVALTEVGGKIMRTIVVTALPGMAADVDPERRTNDTFAATLRVTPLR